MKNTTTFTATGAAITVTSPAGGSGAATNPASAAAAQAGGYTATALLIQNAAFGITLLRWGAASFAPQPIGPGLEDITLNPGGIVLITDATRLAASTILVSGAATFTAGNIATALTVNS